MFIKQFWRKVVSKGSKLQVVIFDLSTSAYVDSSGARLIKKLYLDLEARGISFKVADAHSEVRDILRFEDIEHLLGHVSRKDSVHDVVVTSIADHVTKHGLHRKYPWVKADLKRLEKLRKQAEIENAAKEKAKKEKAKKEKGKMKKEKVKAKVKKK